jgi:hypothetical protein
MSLRREARRRGLVALAAASLIAGLTFGTPATAIAAADIIVDTVDQEINGDADCSLQEAIYAANRDDNQAPDPTNPGTLVTTGCTAGSGHDTIWLPPMGVFTYADPIDDADNFVGPTVTPIITSGVTIEGRGARLQRLSAGRLTRAFAVGVGGALDLREVHVKGFSIRGGNGADGGGGGMGAGGAIYVVQGSLRVQWSTFEGNGVWGGNGSRINDFSTGGGGGLSGDGGPHGGDGLDSFYGGGGGGGSRGDGSAAFFVDLADPELLGGGGGGRVTSANSWRPGETCGGTGATDGLGDFDGAEDGSNAPCAGGGGGGGNNIQEPIDVFCGGDGGDGHYGGGGGGGGHRGDGGDGGFGGGGGGNGGDGGFGAGGGGADFSCRGPGADHGQGGAFGGDGADGHLTADDPAGGGGAGLGGAIFGDHAAISISNSTFAGNVAEWGRSGGTGANDGRAAGGAVFLAAGSLDVASSTFAGNNVVTVTNGGGGAIAVYEPESDGNPATSEQTDLLLRNTIIGGNGVAECYTRNGVDTAGSDGNIVTDSTPNNLGDPACPGVTGSDDPALGPLQLNAPGRTPTMAIGPTSNAIDVAVGVVGGAIPLDDQRGILRPQGLAADIGAFEYEGPPAPPPGSAPVTSIHLVPPAPNGSNGWYTSSVGVAFTATDVDGDLGEIHCAVDPAVTPTAFSDLVEICSLLDVTGDGQHSIYAASSDVAGHRESPLVWAGPKIDATGPSLAPTLNVPSITLGQTGVSVAPNASDATSGVAGAGCGSLSTAAAGVQSVSCTATDLAGNQTSVSASYLVQYRLVVLGPPTGSKWWAGGFVPVVVALTDARGRPIPDAEAAALAAACRVTFSAAGAQGTTPRCLKYERITNLFAGAWKLSRSGVGSATMTIRATYPGTAIATSVSRQVTIKR